MKRNLLFNSAAALLLQFITIICGFIIPRLILSAYGSEVNGLLNSIMQFLSIISYFDAGLTTVVQANLYKPIAENNVNQINCILSAAAAFFRKIACFFICYVIILLIFYPKYIVNSFSYPYVDALIIAMSIDFLGKYFFGIVDQVWLTANQKNYIYSIIQISVLITNTILSVILVKAGFSVQSVKYITAIIFILRPVALRLYVNQHYSIKRNVYYEGEPIRQKYNGIAQHIAFTVLNNTDIVLLSVFSSLQNVSIYSVYHLVARGLTSIVNAMVNVISPAYGSLWVKKENEKLAYLLEMYAWIIHSEVVMFFGCSIILIVPFVMLYTKEITDANYYQPIFSMILMCGSAALCLRIPYNSMIMALGHFKETQKYYIVGAAINVILSFLMVGRWKLNGVAVGTLIASLFYTLWMVIYVSHHFVRGAFKNFIKQCIIDIVIISMAFPVTYKNIRMVNGYAEWIIYAGKTVLVWACILVLVNMIFNKRKMLQIFRYATK